MHQSLEYVVERRRPANAQKARATQLESRSVGTIVTERVDGVETGTEGVATEEHLLDSQSGVPSLVARNYKQYNQNLIPLPFITGHVLYYPHTYIARNPSPSIIFIVYTWYSCRPR